MEENDNLTSLKSSSFRIEDCEVCGENKAKYTCPRCELRTCCLECVKIHKKELECDGVRDKVKFKRLKDFNNIDLLNDYRFLEETARLVSKSVKLPPKSCYHSFTGILPQNLYKIKIAASSRGVQLNFLPPSFSRHRSNTSYLNYKTKDLFWRIDWVFPQADNLVLTDNKVLDLSLLSACLHKYIAPEERTYPSLSFYQAAGHPGVSLLLKAEYTAPDRYYLLEPTTTLRENLEGKSIIEHPVIYVVLNHHIHLYDVLSEEEEKDLKNRQRNKQVNRNRIIAGSNNFLFPRASDENDLDGECIDTEDKSNEGESDGFDRPFNKNFRFPHRGRRGRYFRRNNRGNRHHPHGGNKRGFNSGASDSGLVTGFGSGSNQTQ